MKIKHMHVFLMGITIISFITSMFIPVQSGHAQSLQNWSDPVNISNSGSAYEPQLIVDMNGTFHTIWFDLYDGYKYSRSTDGITWTEPKSVKFPFSPSKPSKLTYSLEEVFSPKFIVDTNGMIHVFWQDEENNLFHSRAQSNELDNPSVWVNRTTLSDSAIDYDVVIDRIGNLHLSYLRNLGTVQEQAGIYYRQYNGSTWLSPGNLYLSQYFRSLTKEEAHVRLAVSDGPETSTVYVVWDVPTLKRILAATSSDSGKTWGESWEIVEPQESSAYESPHTAEIEAIADGVLLTWQVGQSEKRCAQYSRWSEKGVDEWGETIKMFDELSTCPERIGFVSVSDDYSIAFLKIQDGLAMIAWNGKEWSNLQVQNELSTFTNPVTLDSILLRCQQVSLHNDRLFVVGCDEGSSEDIWYTSRSLGPLEGWFPPPSAWSSPSVISNVSQRISSISSTTDVENNIHTVWVQTALSEGAEVEPAIYYAMWDGFDWSTPTPIIINLNGLPAQLFLTGDNQGRLLLVWVDATNGELLFSWANASKANIPIEWHSPVLLPSLEKMHSSPNVLVDHTGNIVIAYARAYNENRGVYVIRSNDSGENWSAPFKVFDAVSANWDSIGKPITTLSEDGRLHVLFSHYSVREKIQPEGLYYSQSVDGGVTWSGDIEVSNGPVYWSEIIATENQTLHLLWQEKDEGVVTNHHRISTDNGLTWNNPITVSSTTEQLVTAHAAMDPNGQLHFFQLTADTTLMIQEWVWNGSRWDILETREFLRNIRIDTPPVMETEITPDGYLNVLAVLEIEVAEGKLENRLLGVGRSIDVLSPGQELFQAVLPTTAPDLVPTVSPQPEDASTPAPLLTELDDSGSTVYKNIIGVVLIVAVLILVIIIVRPTRPKKQQ